MAKIISLFNHKGGVSKTTTTYHLGWKLAELGQKVLIVDADPQCNLTGLTLGIDDYDSLFKFYDSRQNGNIYESIKLVLEGQDLQTKAATITSTKNSNLFILAGHIKLGEADLQIATATTSSASIPSLRNFLGMFYNLFTKTALANNIDIILVDMSPSVSALNMTLLMGSDYFILPISPDFFCYQAIDSLGSVLPEWADRLSSFKNNIQLPSKNPQLLGIISQNFRVYTPRNDIEQGKKMSSEFKKWSEKIRIATNSVLIPKLQKKSMVISKELFMQSVSSDKLPYNIANIQDFNSLMPVSQEKSKPIYEIKQEDTKWTGAVWTEAEKNIAESNKIYTDLANSVLKIIS